MSIVLPALPGFSVRPGTETQAGLGYKCEGSLLLHSCLLQAPVEVSGAGRAGVGVGCGCGPTFKLGATGSQRCTVPT